MAAPAPRDEPRAQPPRQNGWLPRIAWFIGLWLASIAALGAVAWVIRFWLIG